MTIVIVVVIGLVAITLAATLLPQRIVDRTIRRTPGAQALDPADRITAETEVRRSVVEVSTVLLLLVGFYFTFNEVRFTGEQLAVSREELRVTEETQLGERFAAAVEQLGSDDPTVQTAGIYTMQTIARSDPARFRLVLEQTLAAFLRTRAACDPARGAPCLPRVRGAAPAIQTAVTVIGSATEDERAGVVLDLSRVNLTHIDLRGNFVDVVLTDSNMSFANVAGADLRGADMTRARQEGMTGVVEAVHDETTRWP